MIYIQSVRMKKFLIPTDGSDATENAARFAETIGRYFDTEYHVLFVVRNDDKVPVTGPKIDNKDEREKIDDYMSKVTENLEDESRVVKCTRESDSIPDTIVKYAEENDINHIVMGTSGRTGTRRILVGSVAEKVIRKSSVPTTAVKSDDTF